MVSLDILCVSIDLRVYFLCPVIIQFNPLPPQWRRCQKGKHPVETATLMPERHQEASSSIHYRHNGGDARKAHVGRSNYGESRYFVCFHRSQSILLMSCYHPVPSITATMEEMPERHTLSIQFHPYTATMEEMPERHTWSIQFHPLPPQWRRCQKGTREASSSKLPPQWWDARKAHVCIQFHPLSPSMEEYRHTVCHPVPSITATMEEMPERHTWSIQFHPLPPQWRGCQKGTR